YRYYGVGDQGGAPGEKTASWLEKSLAGGGPLRVVSAASDQMYLDLMSATDASHSPRRAPSGIRLPGEGIQLPDESAKAQGSVTARRAVLDAGSLPRYKGDLRMTRHGTGCYTSQAAMRRW